MAESRPTCGRIMSGTSLPATCNTGAGRTDAFILTTTSTMYVASGTNVWSAVGAGAAAWGGVTGTLSNQTDLSNALALKAPLASPTFTTPTLGVASGTSILLGTNTPSGIDSVFKVVRAITGTVNLDNIRDESTIDSNAAGGAFCSFDAAPSMNGSSAYDHVSSLQDRAIYNGSGSMTYHHGYLSWPTHSGAGTLANRFAIKIKDIQGAGPVTNNYGIFIEALSRGTSTNYAMYSQHTGQIYHLGSMQVDGAVVFSGTVNTASQTLTSAAVGGPFLTVNATNGTASNRYTGMQFQSGSTNQWIVQLRAGDGKLYVFDAVNSKARLTIDPTGNVVPGDAALATTATGGFLYIPTCAGAPTGVPAATFTGRVPIVYDSTNNFLYIYSGGWKKSTVYA